MRGVTNDVRIPLPDGTYLEAGLEGPEDGPLIIFAHGSGSSRHSPRNQRVAGILNDHGLRTLLLDLLTQEEEQRDLVTAKHRFDIELLGDRVGYAVDWAVDELKPPAVGLFGASTGAAAALVAAASRPVAIGAVVSRGGRPDLAGNALTEVRAPTLLIVGGRDTTVLELNRSALDDLGTGHELEIVAGATHLFEEPGALDEVAELASDWFRFHLAE
ncbi:MAG TPA: dienelactone hydrolase family protein [Acidimicrobiia bacterium]